MSEVAALDSIEAVMADIHKSNDGDDVHQGHAEESQHSSEWPKDNGGQGEESEPNVGQDTQHEEPGDDKWSKKHLVLEDRSEAEEMEDEEVDPNVRDEIKAALMAGQKTITLSADDASLEAKILEIVRQSRQLDQGDGSQQQYIEIVNDEEGQVTSRLLGNEATEEQTNGQRVVEIDLMNFKLVRYQEEAGDEDGSGHGIGSLVMAEHEDSDGQQYIQISNGDHGSDSETMHIIQNSHPSSDGGMQYVQVIEKDKVPLVYFTTDQPKKPATPSSAVSTGKRKRGEFVLPPDAMSSPNFKLFLYNCKLCDFKCNAIKELTAHKAVHPGISPGRYRNLAKPPNEKATSLNDYSPLSVSSNNLRQYELEYCNQCAYKTVSKTHLTRHIAKCHSSQKSKMHDDSSNSKSYVTYEDGVKLKDTISLYVCKICSFKSESKNEFRRHKCQENSTIVQEYVLS